MSVGEPGIGEPGVEESNKELARRWFHEGWCRGNVDVAYEIFAPDFTLRGERVGPEGPRRGVQAIHAAFADITVGVDLQLAQGETVVSRYTARARHAGEYRGVRPTGRRVCASGIQIWTVRAGKVVADWNVFDEWGLVAQISEDPLRS